MKYIILTIIILVIGHFLTRLSSVNPPISPSSTSTISVLPSPTPTPEILLPPIADFKNRIKKKFFGTYVTPKNSPVKPERFTGYHTGVDVEYGDVSTDVSVTSVKTGQIIYSGYANGYGGFIAQQIDINNQKYIAMYGHLSPSSLVKKETTLQAGDQIGVLGTGYSRETSGERRHLHFALLKGSKLDFRGYVPNQSQLSHWSDPLSFFP